MFVTRKDVKRNLHLSARQNAHAAEDRARTSCWCPTSGARRKADPGIFTTDYQTLPGDGTAALELTPLVTG